MNVSKVIVASPTAHNSLYNYISFSKKDFEGLVEEFSSLLEFATQDKPLLICLDGINELSEECGADLSWIPSELPKNVHFIVSTCLESDVSCIRKLEVNEVPELIVFHSISSHIIGIPRKLNNVKYL